VHVKLHRHGTVNTINTRYYQNAITGGTLWDMPPAMDTFGACGGLETLKINDNLLRDLPESMSLLTNLRMLEVKPQSAFVSLPCIRKLNLRKLPA